MAVTTLSGFSGPPTASQTFGTLRLSENGRHQRRRRKESPSPAPQDEQRTPDSETSTLRLEERCVARVTGFDEYATKAIRTANGGCQDVLVLSWAGCDSVVRCRIVPKLFARPAMASYAAVLLMGRTGRYR